MAVDYKICPACQCSKPRFSFVKMSFEAVCAECAEGKSTPKAGVSLPCLDRNNCTGADGSIVPLPVYKGLDGVLPVGKREKLDDNTNDFSTAHKKSEFCLFKNVESFIEHFGIEYCGFLTLTFEDQCNDRKESQRRFHSLNKNFISKHFVGYIKVMERMKSGAIHYHLIVACKHKIRRNFNFQQVKNRNYSSACLELRQLWKLMRDNLSKYGFGRAELMPVKTNSKGLAKYVSKYISKHINNRLPEDKGARLVQTSLDKTYRWKIATSNFAFVSFGSQQWRSCLSRWCTSINNGIKSYALRRFGLLLPDIDHTNYSEILTEVYGCKWAYFHRDHILSFGEN